MGPPLKNDESGKIQFFPPLNLQESNLGIA